MKPAVWSWKSRQTTSTWEMGGACNFCKKRSSKRKKIIYIVLSIVLCSVNTIRTWMSGLWETTAGSGQIKERRLTVTLAGERRNNVGRTGQMCGQIVTSPFDCNVHGWMGGREIRKKENVGVTSQEEVQWILVWVTKEIVLLLWNTEIGNNVQLEMMTGHLILI